MLTEWRAMARSANLGWFACLRTFAANQLGSLSTRTWCGVWFLQHAVPPRCLVKPFLLNQEYWEPGGGRMPELSSVWMSPMSLIAACPPPPTPACERDATLTEWCAMAGPQLVCR